MVRLIMGEKGTGKTKQLIEQINAAAGEAGSVVCIEAKAALTFDVHYHVRLLSAAEYQIGTYERLRGFISGLYAGNYDTSHVFIDNLLKIVGKVSDKDTEDFLNWLESFSEAHGVKFTISISADPALATEGMKAYL